MREGYAEILHHPGLRSGGPRVKQGIGPGTGRWWTRADDGTLWVWCDNTRPAVQPAPVVMADLTEPLPDRPPNRDRITCALDYRGMHGPEVDEALGVADALDTVVDSWEDGTATPTHDDVRRLATLTGMLPQWFYMGSLAIADVFLCGDRHTSVVVRQAEPDS